MPRPYRIMNIIRIFKIAAAVSAAAAACSCADYDDSGITAAPSAIVLKGTAPSEITFEADGEWYARVQYPDGEQEPWLSISPVSGGAGTCSITVQASSINYLDVSEERRAKVTIKIPARGGASVEVKQPAVRRPGRLTALHRVSATLNGPMAMTFEYDEEGVVAAFTADGVRYSCTRTPNSGTLTMTTQAGESTLSFPMANGRIYGFGPVEWSFYDPNSDILLDRAQVSFAFTYDTGENRKLERVTRTETKSVSGGEELDPAVTFVEEFFYAYDNLRLTSMTRILPHTSGEDAVRDTIIYTLHYPAAEQDAVNNYLTADVWEMVVFPDLQGTPFNSMTGFGVFGLTGAMQGAFPERISAEERFHSTPAPQQPAAHGYTYSTDDVDLRSATTSVEYTGGAQSRTTATTFSYAEQ